MTRTEGKSGSWWGAAALVGATVAAAALGGLTSKPGVWYRKLDKPVGTPPNAVFGPVWTVLYVGIAYAGVRLWRKPASPQRDRALKLWGTQLALNAAWSPVFFGLQRPEIAMGVIAALVPAVAATVHASRKVDPTSAWLMTPYLAWSSYAAYLNAGILLKNQ